MEKYTKFWIMVMTGLFWSNCLAGRIIAPSPTVKDMAADAVQCDIKDTDHDCAFTDYYCIAGSVGIPGVYMKGLPGQVISNESGHYQALVKRGVTYVVSPMKEGYVFEPESITYCSTTPDAFNEDYAVHHENHAVTDSVLTVPSAALSSEQLQDLRDDLCVMNEIVYDRIGPYIKNLRTLYLADYGAVFYLDLAFAAVGLEFKPVFHYEQNDPTWDQTRNRLFPGTAPEDSGTASASATTRLEDDILALYKHAANIRNMAPNEWFVFVLRVTGPQGEPYQTETFRVQKAQIDGYADNNLDRTAFQKWVQIAKQGDF